IGPVQQRWQSELCPKWTDVRAAGTVIHGIRSGIEVVRLAARSSRKASAPEHRSIDSWSLLRQLFGALGPAQVEHRTGIERVWLHRIRPRLAPAEGRNEAGAERRVTGHPCGLDQPAEVKSEEGAPTAIALDIEVT